MKLYEDKISVNSLYWPRPLVQVIFICVSLLIGVQFHNFVGSLATDAYLDLSTRPAAVDAFLPISSLMSLIYILRTGVLNTVHPAGLVIFTLSIALSLLLKRGFCSWVCPFGAAEEWAHKAGRWMLGRNLRMPRPLDFVLRSLRYLLLGFFVYSIASMPVEGLRFWIHGSYNRIADAKMYAMCLNITVVGIAFLFVMGVLSMVFANFWCRYLCPYGALLGIFSLLSPTAVRRDAGQCSGCGRCSAACANRIDVARKRAVRSVECTACFECIRACGDRKALTMARGGARLRLSVLWYGIVIVLAFYGTARVAEAANYWQTDTPAHAYRALYMQLEAVAHP